MTEPTESQPLPEADTNVGAAAVAMEEGQQPMKRKRRGMTRIQRKQIAAKRARSEDHEAPDS